MDDAPCGVCDEGEEEFFPHSVAHRRLLDERHRIVVDGDDSVMLNVFFCDGAMACASR